MKKFAVFLLFVLIFMFSTLVAQAIYDPTLRANNRTGIHIIDPSDLSDAAKLVNSNGDWGYVTLVIQKGERDTTRWTPVFNEMRKLHLIPIIRVATSPIFDIWEKPSVDEIDGWISFLNSLPWPTQNRYVVVGNEPNHIKEWGGEAKPDEYANYLKIFSEKLKNESAKFFVLPAGLDASAPNGLFTVDEEHYIRQMIIAVPDVFDYIDGWTSHSYPNPGFSGSETATGRKSIKGYEWELELLKSLGVTRELPVFITETGWVHSARNLAAKFSYAYTKVWNDPKIIAVTPFILRYDAWPFAEFSWKDNNGEFYDFYTAVQNLPKEKGNPILEPLPTVAPTPRPAPIAAPQPDPTPRPQKKNNIFDIIRQIPLFYLLRA